MAVQSSRVSEGHHGGAAEAGQGMDQDARGEVERRAWVLDLFSKVESTVSTQELSLVYQDRENDSQNLNLNKWKKEANEIISFYQESSYGKILNIENIQKLSFAHFL